MAFLYIGPNGKPQRRHSYSAGGLFDRCPYAYKLQKVLGWKERNNKARFEFGKAFELAIQFFHENRGDRDGAIKHFQSLWLPYQNNKELSYTKVEKDRAQCLRIGTDW